MRAVFRQAAFEEGETIDVPQLGNERAFAVEVIGELACAAAFPAGEGDVRVVGAALRLEADALADPLNLGGKGGERLLRFHAGPKRAAAALFEAADAFDAQQERIGADAA